MDGEDKGWQNLMGGGFGSERLLWEPEEEPGKAGEEAAE